MTEVPFDFKYLACKSFLFFFKFHSFSCNLFASSNEPPEPVYISNNPRITKSEEGLIDVVKGWRVRGEDAEVSVPKSWTSGIGGWTRPCMERDGIFRVTFLPYSDQLCLTSYITVGDVLCTLQLAMLVDEDEGVVVRIRAK
jgi:hypothetical protein